MSGIRSCEQCKYGPDFLACQMGKTGKPKSADSSNYEFNPFQESLTSYYLHGSKNMPCFELEPRYSIQGLLREEEAKIDALYSAEVYPYIGGAEAPLVTTEDRQRAYWLAFQALERAVCREPGEFLWHFSLGATYFPLGRFADAVIANSHALALHPDDPRVHYNMATYLNFLTRAAYCGPAFRDMMEKMKVMQEQLKSDWRTYADVLPFNPDQSAYELQKLNITWQYAAVEAVKHFERAKALGLPSSEMEHIDTLIKAMREEFWKLGIVI